MANSTEKTFTFIIVFWGCLLSAILIFGIFFATDFKVANTGPLNIENAKVRLHQDHAVEWEPGKLINLNDFPVRIRCVFQHKGESTLWIKILKPKSELKINQVNYHNAYYIYRVDNPSPIGFIRGFWARR